MRLSVPNSSSSSSQWVMLVVFACVSSLALLPWRIQAQPRTDPTEVAALNAIFDRWDLEPPPSTWNTTGDPCSGNAIDNTPFDSINPFIKCDCGSENGTVCHITQLRVYALSVTGEVPQELQNFRNLNNLDMGQNVLTGNLPSFLGNLTDMQYMTFGINSLSGPIPKELGMLTNLKILGLGSNKFSGPLPSEIGDLTNLEELYIDSAGVSGEIPPTFAKLLKLKTLWASDNDFIGNIPDFFGDLTNLTVLRLQGNSFQGPIPLSLGKLTNLVTLQIGDLINGSSSLAFIQNMTALSKLVLRNCKISDNIPPNIGNYTNLMLLDLSFNNLTGQVPQSLFSLGTLRFLFLGNNSLSGSLQSQKTPNLLNIDLSYNNFSGSLPPWVNENNLNLNLVANNFVLDNFDNGDVLACLQKDFPCRRGSPIWSSFAINCGSSRSITSSNGISYVAENENLTSASYYVNSERWGVSNVGILCTAKFLTIHKHTRLGAVPNG